MPQPIAAPVLPALAPVDFTGDMTEPLRVPMPVSPVEKLTMTAALRQDRGEFLRGLNNIVRSGKEFSKDNAPF